MSIRPGQDWGAVGDPPADLVVVKSDAEARALVTSCRRRNAEVPPLGLLGGDLCRTLGGRGDEGRLRDGPVTRVEVDLGVALLDGRRHWFVAHLVARGPLWRGPAVAAMNAEWLGRWDVAPRAHPGDGLLDVLEGEMGFQQRLIARRRLPSGTHLPHPAIRVHRVGNHQFRNDRALPVRLDGEAVGRASSILVRVEPAALTVCV